MSKILKDFWIDDVTAKEHFCTPTPTNLMTFRKGVLGQYWQCNICGVKTWEPVPVEDEKSH